MRAHTFVAWSNEHFGFEYFSLQFQQFWKPSAYDKITQILLHGIRMLQNTVKWNYRFYLSHAIAPWALLDWQVKLVLGVLNQFVAQSITGWNSDNQNTLNLLRNYTSLLYSIPGHLSYFAPLFRDSSHDEQHVNCQKVGNWQIATGWFLSFENPLFVIFPSLISCCNN